MSNLIEAWKELLGVAEGDAALVVTIQNIEHYEIARYGTLIAWAKQLGMMEAANLLEQTLEQEKKADKKLNDIALNEVNRKAA